LRRNDGDSISRGQSVVKTAEPVTVTAQ